MKTYKVIIGCITEGHIGHVSFNGIETITYDSSNGYCTIQNDEMLTAKIPLSQHLYLHGKNNASIDGRYIVSIEVREE